MPEQPPTENNEIDPKRQGSAAEKKKQPIENIGLPQSPEMSATKKQPTKDQKENTISFLILRFRIWKFRRKQRRDPKEIKWTDSVIAYSTLAMMFATIAIGYLAYQTGQQTDKLIDAAKRQAGSADIFSQAANRIDIKIGEAEEDFRTMAESSKNSIMATQDAIRLEERAWVGVALDTLPPVPQKIPLRLQTDYIDLYQVHGWDSNTPLEETLRTLDDLVRQGKVRYIGLSNMMSWQAATAVMLQEHLGLERYVTAQMYYSLVGRGLEYEFQSFAEFHNVGILVWSPLAGGFLTGKYSRSNPAPAGTRFAEAGSFVPFDKEMGYHVVEALKKVAGRHDASPARVALAWVLGRPAVSSVIIAARKVEQLEDNILAVDLLLSEEEVRLLDAASDPGVPYPKWMVLQLDTAEDPRSKILYPERYVDGGSWKDLRGTSSSS